MVSLPPGTIRNYNVQLQSEYPFKFMVLNLTNTFTNLILGGVAISIFMYANMHKNYAISQHIYLCVIGYIILMVQVILSVNIHTGWARAFSCKNKRAIHYTLQIIGSILGIAGSSRVISLQRLQHLHFRADLHSVIGIITMLLTIVSLIGGVMNLFSDKITLNKKFLKLVHTVVGCITIVFAFITIAVPSKGEIYKKYFGESNEKLLLALIIISLILILSSPIMNLRRMLV